MAIDLAELMRIQLAQAGIAINPTVASRSASVPARATREPDRAAIRAVLLERGARPNELEWLIHSAPSLEAARAFTPTRKL